MNKIDLHNDLLNYLMTNKNRTPYDNNLSCSIPQMIAGNIRLQILAAFSLTPNDNLSLYKQFNLFLSIKNTEESLANRIMFLWAIEDAQQLNENCLTKKILKDKISYFINKNTPPVYISLTWLGENEFGGGDRTNVGLKSKGYELIDTIANTNIAIDLSHASDKLAYDIINYREKKSYHFNIIASHTNFRGVNNVPRNISDELAQYILLNNGIIGLSFSKNQLGNREHFNLQEHYEYGMTLNENFNRILCLGGDLYHEEDVPIEFKKNTSNFYEELSQAKHYKILDNFSQNFLFLNAYNYLNKNNYIS